MRENISMIHSYAEVTVVPLSSSLYAVIHMVPNLQFFGSGARTNGSPSDMVHMQGI